MGKNPTVQDQYCTIHIDQSTKGRNIVGLDRPAPPTPAEESHVSVVPTVFRCYYGAYT